MQKNILQAMCLLCVLLFGACRMTDIDKVEALPFCENDTTGWGLLSVEGEVMFPAGTWRHAPTPLVNGRFAVPDEKGYFRLYDEKHPQQPLGSKAYYRIGHFFADVTVAQSTPESVFVLIDRKGEEVAVLDSSILLIHNFAHDRALAYTERGKYGYIDTQGRWVIPAVYDYAADFSEGRALVGRLDMADQMRYVFIDKNGAMAVTLGDVPPCMLGNRYEEQLLACRELDTGRCVYLNRNGTLALRLPSGVTDASSFRHGLAVIRSDHGLYGVLNRKGQMVVSMAYDDVRIASSHHVFLCKDGQWTKQHIDGREAVVLHCDSLSQLLPGNVLVARRGRHYRMMDADGQWLGKTWAGRMSVDATVLGQKAQVLYRELKVPAGKILQDSLPSTLPLKHPVPAVKEQVAEAQVPVQVNHRVALDWHKIGKENPFYAEAVKVVSGKLEENDAEHRRVILNYVEHLRSSYTTKDIDFLTQLFSERALIVVGTVIRVSAQEQEGYLAPAQVVYNVKSKQEYLTRLRKVFQANKRIDLHFSDFKIMRHPTMQGIYGVSLRQQYESDRYSDDGYLFLLWDFRNPSMPKIHVRTWQPAFFNGHQPLPKEDVLDIRNFNLQ